MLDHMKKFFLFLFVMSVGCLSAEKYYISIDVLRPGDITFASSVAHLLLVNNTVQQPSGFGHSLNVEGQNTLVEQRTDSMPLFALASMQEELQMIGFFSSVQWIDETQNRDGSFYAISRLTSQEVDSLCRTYGADAVLALNRIAVTDQITCQYSEYSSSWTTALDVTSLASWSLHYPNSQAVVNKHYADSLYWQTEDFDLQNSYLQLPDRGDAEVDLALLVGEKTVKRMLPAWQRTERFFYTNQNKRIIQGMDSIPYQKWDAALTIWNTLHEDASKLTQAYAAANVAVIYELKGDYDSAIKWVEKACNVAKASWNYQLNGSFLEEQQSYLQQLRQRRRDDELLKQQL